MDQRAGMLAVGDTPVAPVVVDAAAVKAEATAGPADAVAAIESLARTHEER
jgi:hypothetical protein